MGKTWQRRLKHLWSTLVFTGRWVDWKALRDRGFEGVVFDKDNTLTAPYALAVWPALGPSLQECQAIFEGRVALLSNSAGTSLYSVAQNRGGAVLFCIVEEKNSCPIICSQFFNIVDLWIRSRVQCCKACMAAPKVRHCNSFAFKPEWCKY